MEITSTEKYLTIGAMSFNKRRIKSIKKDGDIILIDATGREDPESAPNNVIPFKYQAITQPVFNSAADFKAYLVRKSRPVENPVISNIVVSNITETAARITCTVDNKNSNTAVTVEYGTTNAYGQTSAPVTITELGQAVIDLAGLLVYTPYFFRIKAVNSKATTYLVGAGLTTSYPAEFDAYLTRVTADAGIVRSNEFTKSYIAFLKNQGRYNDVKLLIAPEMGTKRRVSGINTYISKAHSPQLAANDAAQVTELSQPFLAGNIAPNERLSIINPQASLREISHPSITFLNNQAWSVEICLNWNGTENADDRFIGSGATNSNIGLKSAINRVVFQNSSGGVAQGGANLTSKVIGKSSIMHFIANGQGNLKVYLNGGLLEGFTIDTGIVFSKLFQGRNSTRMFYGSILSYAIYGVELSAAAIGINFDFLRSLVPEVSSITIGSQIWATSNLDVVCTPQGNIINEVQINANSEKITVAADRDFSSDTGFWSKAGLSTIANGVANIKALNGADASQISRANILTVGKWYKFTYTIVANRGGSIALNGLGGAFFALDSAVGTHTVYAIAASPPLDIKRATACDIDIDNVSLQEVGWANSQELYDAVYAITAGTVEQKTYAAVKAAAMWSYYDGDPAKGAVYGKLYNWFATKLLQMDIDYYNTENPTKLWGWRVPTKSDWDTIVSQLGINPAYKVRDSSNLYWGDNNGNNQSGLSVIPAGQRNESNSLFYYIGTRAYFRVQDEYAIVILNTSGSINTSGAVNKQAGYPIRLIKT